VKQVTISIDEALLARAELLAAERGVSVEEMIRNLLTRETSAESEDAYRARMEMVAMARRPDITRRLIPWTREETNGITGAKPVTLKITETAPGQLRVEKA
jgi:hypothetical protein